VGKRDVSGGVSRNHQYNFNDNSNDNFNGNSNDNSNDNDNDNDNDNSNDNDNDNYNYNSNREVEGAKNAKARKLQQKRGDGIRVGLVRWFGSFRAFAFFAFSPSLLVLLLPLSPLLVWFLSLPSMVDATFAVAVTVGIRLGPRPQ